MFARIRLEESFGSSPDAKFVAIHPIERRSTLALILMWALPMPMSIRWSAVEMNGRSAHQLV
jgi:hypothetical protein